MNIFNILNFNEFREISKKSSGHEKGGIFEREGTKYMIKYMDVKSIIAEYMGSNIARYLLPGRAPEVFLVKNGTNICTASKFLDNFNPLEKYIYKDKAAFNNMVIQDQEARDIAIGFTNHGDIHNRNLGVIEDGKNFKAAVVDFSRSLNLPSKAIIPFKYWSLAFKNEITYDQITELLEELLISVNDPEFKDLLDNIALTIDAAFDNRDKMVQVYRKYCAKIISAHLKACQKELLLAKILSDELPSEDFWSNNCLSLEFVTYMSGILIQQASWDGDKEGFSQTLQKLSNCPGLMHDAFQDLMITIRDVKPYLDEMFVHMLPYLQHSPDLTEKTLKYSVKGDHKEYFEKILPYIAQSPALIKATFEASMLHSKLEYFEKVLPHMIKFPDVMKKVFEDSLQKNKMAYFEKMLPYMIRFPDVIKKAFEDSLQNDKIEYFKKMLPFQSDEEIGKALGYVLKFNQAEYLESILPYTLHSLELLKKVVTAEHLQPDTLVVIQNFIKMCELVGSITEDFLLNDYRCFIGEQPSEYDNPLVGEIDTSLPL